MHLNPFVDHDSRQCMYAHEFAIKFTKSNAFALKFSLKSHFIVFKNASYFKPIYYKFKMIYINKTQFLCI